MEYEGKDGPSSKTGGVKAFPIATRFQSERERLAGGFTDADRAYRKQFLKDQELLPSEPTIDCPVYYRERYNPIRRFYMYPLNTIFNPLKKTLGEETALTLRFSIGRGLLFVAAFYAGVYWLKYNGNDWTKTGGWRVIQSHDPIQPGSSKPLIKLGPRPGSEYHDDISGFKQSPI